MSQDLQDRSMDGPYLFISYVSPDREKVKATLDVLYQRGFRYWYDQFIDGGDNWEDSIMKHIEGSDAFLGFISHDFGERPVALAEIEKAFEI